MIELHNNELVFRFPEVHPRASCTIDFQRTLRIPDDNREYPLPPGLGAFPVAHVDDYADRVPAAWREHGGVFIPMYQSEALWIRFEGEYPCAIKIAAGKINAVSGGAWSNGLSGDPQDYVVTSRQPWLDGFNVSEEHVRQFVAMPLGDGFTAEEQITGEAEHGGLQIIAYPMKADFYAEHFERIDLHMVSDIAYLSIPAFCRRATPDMGLAPGGLMRQKIYEDRYGIDAWDMENGYRCFVHLVNSEGYHAVTGSQPPHRPFAAKQYTDAGLPWFDYYSDGNALPGAAALRGLTSVAAKIIQQGGALLSGNDPVRPKLVRTLRSSETVRDGEF